MAFLQQLEEYNFDEYDEITYNNYENKNKILDLWEQLKKFLNNNYIFNSKLIFPGQIGIFDERGKCKDLNLIIYDTNNNKYIFDWYGYSSAENIWNKYDIYGEYLDLDKDPVPKFINHIKYDCPQSITIIKSK
jgi:hypothetical protein